MSALRQRLKSPATYLLVLALGAILVTADSLRTPDHQVSSRAYLGTVRLYQRAVRPMLEGHVQCRFRPSCSNYSMEAVRRYGLGRGLRLTASRLWRCRSSVPLNTPDPVL